MYLNNHRKIQLFYELYNAGDVQRPPYIYDNDVYSLMWLWYELICTENYKYFGCVC